MKVLIINGSPRNGGNSLLLIEEIKKTFSSLSIDSEVLSIGTKDIRGCIACAGRAQKGMAASFRISSMRRGRNSKKPMGSSSFPQSIMVSPTGR